MLLDIFEDNLKIRPATADGPNVMKIIFICKGGWFNDCCIKEA